MLTVLQSQRRYFVFDKGTIKRLVRIIQDLSSYKLEGPQTSKVLDVFYDSDIKILEQNNLILRKRITGAKATLKLKRTGDMPETAYVDKLRQHEREKEILAKDPLSKHYFFLNNALSSMYFSPLKFDPDKLFDKMQVTLTIDTKEKTYTVFGPGGFKAEINYDCLKANNYQTKQKNSMEFVQIKMLSAEVTLPRFEDFITRVEKHCKEIIATKDSRYDMARNITKPPPSKEEIEKHKLAMQKKTEEADDFYKKSAYADDDNKKNKLW